MAAVTPDLLVDDVMRRWPATIRVFLDQHFMCVGCPIGCFHSVEQACREHAADLGLILDALNAAARGALPAGAQPA